MKIRDFAFVLSVPGVLAAQGTRADYERAHSLQERLRDSAVVVPQPVTWIAESTRFWYGRQVKGGTEYVMVDAATLDKKPAFDHARLAETLSKATGEKIEPLRLPLQPRTSLSFVDKGGAVELMISGSRWRVELRDYSVKDLGPPPPPRFGLTRSWAREMLIPPAASPDGNWEALSRNYNLYLRAKGSKEIQAFSTDGSEGEFYAPSTIRWSPDSKRLAVYRVRPGYDRETHYVESAPEDQLQPRYSTRHYNKPGDALDVQRPVIFDLEARKQINIDNSLFPNAYSLSPLAWRKTGESLTFEYNQRGHQAYRIIEVNGLTGAARAVISEEPKTFFCYSSKKFRQDIADGKEIIWMSERDGWNHLYLYEDATGKVKNQITRGNWVVRGVDNVDEERRQVWFHASGMDPGQDPYFNFYFRVNFDGSGLTRLTPAGANHAVSFSPDMKYYVDTWSRVDQAPITALYRTDTLKQLAEIERGDVKALEGAGWKPPEVFTAKGRDGQTDICGVIYRPAYFDASRRYPVVEYIYAGPHDSFVPKSFAVYSPLQALAEIGFVVVQIDGMGTSNRSKAFHDFAWKNLADAGFRDRILWHKAVAAKYPYYDLSRVGIYGHSAGGQNAMGALLFHPEFYSVAVSSCGCHDNRMDKIWWNEQWMGWPVGPEYAACSNVENAHRLQGKLLLSVGEMDENVDPASTMQVVNALIKANKNFELLVLPGQGHSTGAAYGDRKRFDFFVRHLLKVEPPDWNRPTSSPAAP